MGLWQPNGGLTLGNVQDSENFLLNAKNINSYLNPKYFVDVSYLQSSLQTLGNYTKGPIVDPSIPTINISIPGFGTGSSTTSTSLMIGGVAGPILLAEGRKARRQRRRG